MVNHSTNATHGAPNHRPIVRLVNVHKRFGDLVVLNGVNLELQSGQTTVIIGESGSGKSVLLNHVVRLLKPDRGEVYFHDQFIDFVGPRGIQTRGRLIIENDFGIESNRAGKGDAFFLPA